MHILFLISDCLPSPGRGGSNTAWAIVSGLRAAGHAVSVCVLRQSTRWEEPELLGPLSELGIPVHFLDPLPAPTRWNSLRRILPFRLQDCFVESRFLPAVKRIVSELRPDSMWLFMVRTIAATADKSPWPPRYLFSADLEHRTRLPRLAFDLKYQVGWRRYWRALRNVLYIVPRSIHHLRLMPLCDHVVCHVANEAAWLRAHGVPRTSYLPLPMPDPLAGSGRVRLGSRPREPRTKLRIIFVGKMHGIASLSCFPPLIEDILPALERSLGPEGFELHLIGTWSGIPPSLEGPLLGRTQVKIRGFVENLEEEYSLADFVLIPTPIIANARSRVLEALANGCCVVSHSSNALAFPELKAGENILFADTGAEVAAAAKAILERPELADRIGRMARSTFEQYYEAKTACRRMIALIAAPPEPTGRRT